MRTNCPAPGACSNIEISVLTTTSCSGECSSDADCIRCVNSVTPLICKSTCSHLFPTYFQTSNARHNFLILKHHCCSLLLPFLF